MMGAPADDLTWHVEVDSLSWRSVGVLRCSVTSALLTAHSLRDHNNGVRLTAPGCEILAVRDTVSVRREECAA